MKFKGLRMFRNIAIALMVAIIVNIIAPISANAAIFNKSNDKVLKLKDKSDFESFHEQITKVIEDIRNNIAEKNESDLHKLTAELKSKIKEYDKKIQKENKSIKRSLWWRGLSNYSDRADEAVEVFNKVEKLSNELETLISDGINDEEYKKADKLLNDAIKKPTQFDQELTDTLPNQQINKEVKKVEKNKLRDNIITYSISDNDFSKGSFDKYLNITKETAMTELIKDKAKEIGKNPLDLYHFVRNNIMFEPYAGSRKGATGTLELMAGNSYDQSSLLIALFRANNIPSRYVEGQIEINIEDLMKWVGATTKDAAINIMAGMGQDAVMVVDKGEIVALRTKHVWVEAYIATNEYRGNGETKEEYRWIPFDPSFKMIEKSESIDVLSKFNFKTPELNNIINDYSINENGQLDYANFDGVKNLFDDFKKNIDNSEQLNELIGKNIEDIIGGYKIIPEELSVLPYTINNKLLSIDNKIEEIKSKDRDGIQFYLTDNLFSELSYRADAVDLYSKRLTLSWEPYSEEDKKIVEKYGDILSTPPNLIWVKPVIKVDGKTVASGKGVPVGQQYTFQTTIKNVGIDEMKSKNVLSAGGIYALGLDFGAISDKEILKSKEIIDGFSKRKIKSNYYTDEVSGELLNAVIKSYFMQTDVYNHLLSSQYNIADNRFLSFGMVGLEPNVSYLFGRPYSAELGRIYVDIDLSAHASFSRDSDSNNRESYLTNSGILSSMSEHNILEQLVGMSSVSTIKVIYEATKQGIPIYTLDKKNVNEILPKLNIDEYTKKDITNSINQGRTITIPESEIEYYDWTGTGYIVVDEETGSTGYMISGGHAGGMGAFDLGEYNILEIIGSFAQGITEGLVTTLMFMAIGYFAGPVIAGIIGGVTFIYGAVQLILNFDTIVDSWKNASNQERACIIANILGDALGGFLGGKVFNKAIIKPKVDRVKTDLNKAGINNISDDLIVQLSSKVSNTDEITKLIKKMDSWGLSDDTMREVSGLSKNRINKFKEIADNLDDTIKCDEYSPIILEGINSNKGKQEILNDILSACFTGDTLVRTSVGIVAIENINSGDFVLARNPETNEVEQKKVIENVKSFVNDIVYISIKDKVIGATPNHPIYVVGKGYVQASKINVGDKLILYGDEEEPVKKLEYKHFDEGIYVYNLELEDSDNYLISELGLLVKGKCSPEVTIQGFNEKLKIKKRYSSGSVVVVDDGSKNGLKVLLPTDFDPSTGKVIKDSGGNPIRTFDIKDFHNKLNTIEKNPSLAKQFAKDNGFNSVQEIRNQYKLINDYLDGNFDTSRLINASKSSKDGRYNMFGNVMFKEDEVLIKLEMINPANTTNDVYNGVKKGTYEVNNTLQFKAAWAKVGELYKNTPDFNKKYPELYKAIKESINGSMTEEKVINKLISGEGLKGYTWHHNHRPGEFQLIKTSIHNNYRHTGGDAFWGGSKNINDLDKSFNIKTFKDIKFK